MSALHTVVMPMDAKPENIQRAYDDYAVTYKVRLNEFEFQTPEEMQFLVTCL